MNQPNVDNGPKAEKDKKMLLLLAVVFILPFTVASTLHLLGIRPGGDSFGQLVSPIVELKIPEFHDVAGKSFTTDEWSKIWNIVMVEQASCNAACEANVDKLNRVERSMPKEKGRVQRILLLKDQVDTGRINQLQEKYPALIILPVQETDQQQFVSHFTDEAPVGSIYLVDPLNNLMMYYPQDIEPKALRSDIKKLLKNSWGG